MRASLPRLVFALSLIAVSLLRAESVSRTPPAVFRDKIVPLLTPLPELAAGHQAFPDDNSQYVVLLDETVHYRADDGVDYLVYHDVLLARSQAAAESMGNRIYAYDREHDSIFLVTAATIRPDGTRQELDDRAAFLQTPQREAENGLYTSEQELNLVFPNIGPGAVTESIVVIREDKPLLPGEFATRATFGASVPTFRSRLLVDFPTEALARVRTVESSPQVPPPVSEKYGERTRRTWTGSLIDRVEWEEGAPPLRFRAPTVWLSTIASWDRIAAWFGELARSRQELGPVLEQEVARVTEGLKDRKAIVDRLCAMVSNEVRYTGLEFGLAGFQPYPCAEVWKNRYGDCKDKANLLRALLAHQGIAAHFLLLNTDRAGRIETRSPSWKQFNHVILAVDDGAHGWWYCDPTIRYLPAGRIGLADSARSALMVKDDGSGTWIELPDLLDHALHYRAELKLGAKGELAGWFSIEAEGGDAAAYTEYYNNFIPSTRRRALQSVIEDFYPGAEVMDVDYAAGTASTLAFRVRAYFIRKPQADSTTTIGFGYPASFLPSVGTASDRLFPYATTRRVHTFDATVELPAGWNAAQVPSAYRADSQAASFAATWQTAAGSIGMHLSWQPKAANLPAADYAVFQRSVRGLRAWLEQPVAVVPAAQVADARAALDDFPLLPTGEGQLRLLDERFPSGEHDAERRTALEQVLRWFPDDATTAFTAKVQLALVVGKENDLEIARQIRQVLAESGSKVSQETRGWARYLAARAAWWGNKDPEGLKTLLELAADAALSNFRRAWSAHYAATFLAETDAAGAMGLVAEWDSQAVEARDAILRGEARYLAKLQDAKITAEWARRILQQPPKDADAMFALTLDAALDLKDSLPDTAFAHFVATLRPLLSDPAAFPATQARLEKAGQLANAGLQRRTFVTNLSRWIETHSRPWLTIAADPKFKSLAEVEKELDAKNDAHDGKAVVNAAFQLARFHSCDFATLAKYLYWSAWWLENQGFDPELLTALAGWAHDLPNAESEDIGAIWFKHASAERKAGRIEEARAEYRTILAAPGSRPFQRAEASGELGEMELGQGDADAALAAFALTARDHLSHVQGSRYLMVATMLHLERGQWDQAAGLLAEIGKTKKEYRDKTAWATMMEYLLKSGADPEGLKTYWKFTAGWRSAWDGILQKYGVVRENPARPALIADVSALEAEIESAREAKDKSRYLRNLDLLVRTAAAIPIYLNNAFGQIARAQSVSPEFHRDLVQFALQAAGNFPDVADTVQWDARLWEAGFLIDVGNPAAAATAARKLYLAPGPSPRIRSVALQFWLSSATDAGLTEAIDTATRALGEGGAIPDRAGVVANLSDALTRTHDTAANLTLLAREADHPDIKGAGEVAKRLAARLTALRQDLAASGAFAKDVAAWLRHNRLEFLPQVPPDSLQGDRHSSPGPHGWYELNSLPFHEAIKCNLLLALDEQQSMPLRYQAFLQVVTATAFTQQLTDQCVEHLLSAARLPTLPDPVRSDLVSNGLSFLLQYGHPEAARLLEALPPAAAGVLRQNYGPAFDIVSVLDSYSPAAATAAFEKCVSRPIGNFEIRMIRVLLGRMVQAGDAPTATALLEGATNLQLASGTSQSAASVRLDWSRLVRRESGQRPFYERIAANLVARAKPGPEDLVRFRGVTWTPALHVLDHRTRARAIAAALQHGWWTVDDPLALVQQLSAAITFSASQPDFGPEMTALILSAPELDDVNRARWLEATAGFTDYDEPDLANAFRETARRYLADHEATQIPATRRALRVRFAIMAVRSSPDENPDELFGMAPRRELDASLLRTLQFKFFASRNRLAEAAALMQQMDAEQLSGADLYPDAERVLRSENNAGEMKLLQAAALERLKQQQGKLWLEPHGNSVWHLSQVARILGAAGQLDDAFFEHALSGLSDDYDRNAVKVARANLQQDWKTQRSAADAMLRGCPTNYDAVFRRGEAAFHLGDRDAAGRDLRAFLAHALDSAQRPEAEAMLGSSGR